MSNNYLFTSESVTEGHPDKICDQISDAILDDIISKDPQARVAAETTVSPHTVFLMGEITTSCTYDPEQIARSVIREIGYTVPEEGFDADHCKIITNLNRQSPDIALGVDHSLESKSGVSGQESQEGAGDQGMMFGYACNETPELMPMTISLAHKLSRQLAAVRKENIIPYLRPDGKSQVTIEYENHVPKRIDAVVVSSQHRDEVSLDQLRSDIKHFVLDSVLPEALLDSNTKIYINPTGRFVVGGPMGDTGLTGRKIIVDTYGGVARHGGGAFSGKDPTKVDRSAAYMARYVAKNIVAAGLADRCEIQFSYAIGVAEPVSLMVSTYGTGKVSNESLSQAVKDLFDLRPSSIIKTLQLRSPIYRPLAAYGHIGREDLPVQWEKTDKVDALKHYFHC